MTAGFYSNILVIFSTDFAKLESGPHFAIQLVLLLSNFNVILFTILDKETQVRVNGASIWILEAAIL